MADLCSRCGHYILQLWFLLLTAPHIRQGSHHVGHRSTFLVFAVFLLHARGELLFISLQGFSMECTDDRISRITQITTNFAWLWPPCVADADIIFCRCGFYLLLSFFPRLISAVADWTSTLLRHMMSLQYGKLRPTNGRDRLGSLGTPTNFNGFASSLRYCSDIAQWRPTKPCMTFDRLLAATLYIHLRGLLHPDGILPGAKLTLCPSLAFSYIGTITGWHLTSGCEPKFVECYK